MQPQMAVPDITHRFHDSVMEVLERIRTTQMENIRRAASLVADTVERDGIVYAFGSGHSQSIAVEFYYRAGGLARFDVIQDKTFGRAERLPGYAALLLESYPTRPGDLMIAISNSGRNALPVEMAEEARRRGMPVIGITSLAHSRSVAPRQPGGKRLFEICDVAIDNCGVPGDAAVDLDEGVRVGATSTVAGAYIAQSIVCAACEELAGRGVHPPVLLSMNLDEGDDINHALLARVRERIRGL